MDTKSASDSGVQSGHRDARETWQGKLYIIERNKTKRKMTGEPKSLQFFLQRLSVAVQRGNAAAVLGSVGRPPSIDDPFWID